MGENNSSFVIKLTSVFFFKSSSSMCQKQSNSEWETRILRFDVAVKSLRLGHRPSKTTKWGKVVDKIEKCPVIKPQSRGEYENQDKEKNSIQNSTSC
jgi:hypothetical protein